MNHIEQLLQTLAPKGVEFRKLGEVCEILDNRRIPIAKNKRNPGIYPYYGANGIQDYIDSYIFDGDFVLVGEDGSVINKDNTPVVNWASGKIWVNNHAHVLQTKNELKLKFLYFYLQTIDVSYLIFEIELIKQVEVNIDYILNLIEEFAKEHGVEIQGVKTKIEPIINSSIELRNKKDLIMDFIDKYNKDQEVHAHFQDYIHQKREEEFQNIIEENRLNEEKAYSFMQHAFRGGEISFSGTKFPEIIEEKPSMFSQNSHYQEVKEKVAASLSRFFHRFCDLTSAIFKKNGVKKDEVNEK